jgi:peptidoglycan/LPS O-acetylase OafA/YrhL
MIAAYWICLLLAGTWCLASAHAELTQAPETTDDSLRVAPACCAALAAFGSLGLLAATLVGDARGHLHAGIALVAAALAVVAVVRRPVLGRDARFDEKRPETGACRT